MHWIARKFGVSRENLPLLLSAYLWFITIGLLVVSMGSLLPFIAEEYSMNYGTQGLMVSMFQTGSLITSFLVGILPYYVGRKTFSAVMIAAIPLGAMLLVRANIPLIFQLGFILLGIGRGCISNISNITVAEVSKEKSAALNLLHATFSIGALLAPVIVLWSTRKATTGWRWTILGIAVLGVLCVYSVIASPMSNHKLEKTNLKNDSGFLRSKRYWLSSMILLFYLSSEAGMIGWMVSYLRGNGTLGEFASQITPSILWGSILLGRLVCAKLTRRYEKGKILLGLGILQVVFFVGMIATPYPWTILLSIAGVGIGMSGVYPTVLSTLEPQYTSSLAATGTMIAISQVGMIVTPFVIGFVADRIGLAGAILIILASLTIMLALMFLNYLADQKRGNL